VGDDDVSKGKPDPEGLLKIQAAYPGTRLIYVGDTVDDARASRAAAVPFIGIAHPHTHNRDRLLDLFREERAARIVNDVNELPQALSQLT